MNFGQEGWRWCRACEGLFFAGRGTFGVCPASAGAHDPTGSGAYLVQQESNVPDHQSGWRWCWKCEGLFFASHSTQGVCPRDGTGHDDSESGGYVLHSAGSLTRGQPEWRWCSKCEGLYFGGGGRLGVCEAGGGHSSPPGSGNYVLRRPGEYTFDRAVFFAQYARLFTDHRLNAARQAALGRLLGFAETDSDIADLRWIAYLLATALREVGPNYVPIRESGCVDGRLPVCTPINGNARGYGNPVRCANLALAPPLPCPTGQASHTYYGRGYVQLTHFANYRNLGAMLGHLDEFVHDPDTVLDPALAYGVMSTGMRLGLFSPPHSLPSYINASKCDYVNARRIVNPGDTATFNEIARNAERFQSALEASLR